MSGPHSNQRTAGLQDGAFFLGYPSSFACHLHVTPPPTRPACSCSSLGGRLFLSFSLQKASDSLALSFHPERSRCRGKRSSSMLGICDRCCWGDRALLMLCGGFLESTFFYINITIWFYSTTSDTKSVCFLPLHEPILHLYGHQVSCN